MLIFTIMIQPDFLKKGDTILLISPAGKIKLKQILPAIKIFEQWGLIVKIAPHVFGSHYRFAGTDEERLADLQAGLDDTNIKAIICTRGGYGVYRIVDKLKFTAFLKQPKWLVGFSDITVLHNYFNSILKCETLHACMPVNIRKNNTSIQSLQKALWGEKFYYRTKPHANNVFGSATGELIGGNLSIIYSLLATSMSYTTRNKILFIEDTGEPIHNIDRIIKTLKYSGKLASLKALIVGSFSNIDDNPRFGKSVEDIIYDEVVGYQYPVIFNFPVGHTEENYAMYIGRKATLRVTRHGSIFAFR